MNLIFAVPLQEIFSHKKYLFSSTLENLCGKCCISEQWFYACVCLSRVEQDLTILNFGCVCCRKR